MKFTVLLLSVLLVGCNSSTSSKDSSSAAADSSAPYKWTTSFPKTLHISEQFDDDEVDAIEAMGEAWTDSVDDKETFFEFGSRTTEKANNITDLDKLYDSVMGVYKSSNWPDDLPASALAVTQIFGRRYNTGESNEFVNIEHADILVNDDFYDFDAGDDGSGYDLRTVVLHEMGHFLGLQHKSNVGRSTTVMYPSIDSTEEKRYPKSVDIKDISKKYGLTTSSSSLSAMAVAEPKYEIKKSDLGSPIKVLIELHSDGNCIHRVDGKIVERHPASLK